MLPSDRRGDRISGIDVVLRVDRSDQLRCDRRDDEVAQHAELRVEQVIRRDVADVRVHGETTHAQPAPPAIAQQRLGRREDQASILVARAVALAHVLRG